MRATGIVISCVFGAAVIACDSGGALRLPAGATNGDGSVQSPWSSTGGAGGGGGSPSTGGGPTSGAPNATGDASSACADQQSTRPLPDGRTIISFSDGSTILMDPGCPAIPGPLVQSGKFLGISTTIYGCCLPTGRCGLLNAAWNATFTTGEPFAACRACVSYGDLDWSATPLDPNKACRTGIGPDAGADR